MTENINIEEKKHTVPGVIAGFVFQFYYFIYKLLIIKPGETVSFEKLDDTASELDDGVTTLYQLKHTVKNVGIEDGKRVMLTNRATELWKTLDLWRKLIVGESKKNRPTAEQLEYIEQHEFILVVNKDVDDNKLFELCKLVRIGRADLSKVKQVLDEILSERKQNKEEVLSSTNPPKRNVQKIIEDLRDFECILQFLEKVEIEVTSFDNIERKCHEHIRNMMGFPKNDVANVFKDFCTEACIDFKEEIGKGNCLEYKFEAKQERFERVFYIHRRDTLDFRVEMKPFDSDFTKLTCIKQLMKVNDININHIDKIARYTSYFLSFKNKYLELNEKSRISYEEDNNFKQDAIAFYDNEFGYVYDELDDSADDDKVNKKAKELLYKIRSNKLSLGSEQLTIPISNGVYYYLSDECLIGWHYDWKTHFNKE